MSNERKAVRRRLVLVLALLAVIAVIVAGPQAPTASATCNDFNTARVNFYNNAAHTTLVGYCVHGCCETWTCYGESTLYETLAYEISCD
jgi:hypothetical protein